MPNQPNRILTIGVYGFSEPAFFEALTKSGVSVLCDIRMRRGVRGSKYKFANAKYLQMRLDHLGIQYLHLKELAPGEDIRELQWDDDAKSGVKKQDREHLGQRFINEYEAQKLQNLDSQRLMERLGYHATICFLCVETSPKACHRSLVSSKIAGELGVAVENLLP